MKGKCDFFFPNIIYKYLFNINSSSFKFTLKKVDRKFIFVRYLVIFLRIVQRDTYENIIKTIKILKCSS